MSGYLAELCIIFQANLILKYNNKMSFQFLTQISFTNNLLNWTLIEMAL